MLTDRRVILVVDDDEAIASSHAHLLRAAGAEPIVETPARRVEPLLARRPEIDAALVDLRMPEMDGLSLLRLIKLRRPDVGVIMATVVSEIEPAVEATKAGAYNYLLKPLQQERLERVLSSYFENRPRHLIEDPRFTGFITGHAAFEAIFDRIRLFSAADVPVLVQGETGTGKELVAQLLHALSPRAAEEFRPVNVASISPHLFESEFFGHRRGSFTGAIQDHAGHLEDAGSGTLFLDEIGELSGDLQAKLLRVLQEGQYCRVGETQPREVKARLLFATNLDLAAEVREKRFRSDLYYRIANHPIALPPLRERSGDVELLANYFLRKYDSQYGREVEGFHPDAMETLKRYSFPGNVRELEGIVSGCVLLERSSFVQAKSLPAHLHWTDAAAGDLEATKLRTILRVLAECSGNQTLAAKKLGISRATIHRILRDRRLGTNGEGKPWKTSSRT